MILCPEAIFQEKLYELLESSVITISSEKIKSLYTNWAINFDGNIAENKCVYRKSDISSEQIIPENAYFLGIDFPIWFNQPQDGERRIMVLGIDPLRNNKTFDGLNADKKNEVIIGTPYALNDKKMREGKTKHYWELIRKLSENHFVYITDIYKTFFYEDETMKTRSYDYYQNRTNHDSALLKKEIEMIQPDLIITLGGVSYRSLLSLLRSPKLGVKIEFDKLLKYDGVNVLPMVHLSGSTRKINIINFTEINDVKIENNNYGEAYFNIVDRFFKNEGVDQ